MVRAGSTTTGPTPAAVAREAGVSVPTASKVVNGRQDVAPETRRRVNEALDRLGHVRRHRVDVTMASPTLVDLVVHSLRSSWSGAILHGVEEAAHDAGLEVVVSAGLTRTRGGRPERDWLDRLTARGSSGVLFDLARLTPSQYGCLDLPEPPTAVFVCSDKMALGVYEALALRGLRVPDDVSVVGFDDLPEARWATPALTTVRRPLAETAATAVRLLVRLMAGERPDSTRTELSTRLVRRASTAPPRTASEPRRD